MDDDNIWHEDLVDLLERCGAAPVPAPTGMIDGPDRDDLASALAAARDDVRLSEAQAFALAWAVERGGDGARRVITGLGAQRTASPIYPGWRRTVLVRRRADVRDGPRLSDASVSVVYQSALNSKIWWSPSEPGFGVAPRPLGLRRRGRNVDGAVAYKGRLYSLVRRRAGPPPDTVPFEVVGDAHVLQFWEERAPGGA